MERARAVRSPQSPPAAPRPARGDQRGRRGLRGREADPDRSGGIDLRALAGLFPLWAANASRRGAAGGVRWLITSVYSRSGQKSGTPQPGSDFLEPAEPAASASLPCGRAPSSAKSVPVSGPGRPSLFEQGRSSRPPCCPRLARRTRRSQRVFSDDSRLRGAFVASLRFVRMCRDPRIRQALWKRREASPTPLSLNNTVRPAPLRSESAQRPHEEAGIVVHFPSGCAPAVGSAGGKPRPGCSSAGSARGGP